MAFVLVLAYLGLLYTRPQEYLPALDGVPIMPALLGSAFLFWLARRNKRLDAPQYPLVLALVAVMIVSKAVQGWLGGIPIMLGNFLPVVVLFVLVSSLTDTVARHRAFMGLLSVCTVFLAVHGIDQREAGIGWSGAELSQGTRITYLGIFNDPNDLALAFVIVLPMLAYRLASAKGFLARLLWLAGMGVLLYGIYLTNSRGGMLSAASQFLAFSVARWGVVRSAVPAGLGLIGLAALPSRLDSLDADEASAEGRLEAWYSGLWMLVRQPILGVGPGNFVEHHYLAAHNAYVLGFAELGLVGYYFWFSFVALSFLMVWIASRTMAPPDGRDPEAWESHRAIARVYLLSMMGYLIGIFFLSRTYNPLLFMMCALAVAIFQSMRQGWPSFAPIRFKAWALPLLVLEGASIVFLFITVKILL